MNWITFEAIAHMHVINFFSRIFGLQYGFKIILIMDSK